MSTFPVYRELIENPEFQKLKPVTKLFYWCLVSEFNQSGEFGWDDYHAAAMLHLKNPRTVREARAELSKLDLITFTSGRGGKNATPTCYHTVKYARIPAGEKALGKQFAHIQRYDLEALLDMVGDNPASFNSLAHGDVVTFITLCCWKQFNGNSAHGFYIDKSKLRALTGMADITTSVRRLQKKSALFECQDNHHRLYFSNWKYYIPPEQDNHNAGIALRIESNISSKAEQIRGKSLKDRQKRAKDKSPKTAISTEPVSYDLSKVSSAANLPGVYFSVYRQRYGKQGMIGKKQKQELITMGREKGPSHIAQAIVDYLNDETMPGHLMRDFLIMYIPWWLGEHNQ